MPALIETIVIAVDFVIVLDVELCTNEVADQCVVQHAQATSPTCRTARRSWR